MNVLMSENFKLKNDIGQRCARMREFWNYTPVYRNVLVCWCFHWEYYYSRSWVCSWKLNIYQRFYWRHAYIFFLDYQPKSKNKRLFAILDNNKNDKHHPFIITQSCFQSVHWWYEDRLFILFDWIKKLLLYNFNHLFRWTFFFCHSKRNNHSQLPLNWKHICINLEII